MKKVGAQKSASQSRDFVMHMEVLFAISWVGTPKRFRKREVHKSDALPVTAGRPRIL